MKKKLIFSFAFILFVSQISHAQVGWQTILNVSITDLYKTTFINENTGFSVGLLNGSANIIYRTSNSGLNWTYSIPIGPPYNEFFSIAFINDNTGYTVGGDSDEGYIFLKTTDCGISWSKQNLNISQSYQLRDVIFYNESIGYMVGTTGLILKTSNGGINWVIQNSGSSSTLRKIQISKVNENYVYVMNGYSGVLCTSNGGLNWSSNLFNTGESILDISFVNSFTGYVSGGLNGSPLLYKTINGGVNWISLSPNIPPQNRNGLIYFLNENTGIFLGSYVYKTTNAGITWKPQECYPSYTFYRDICFINDTVGFITCTWQSIYNGIILRTNSFGDGAPNSPSNLIARRQYGVNRLQWTDNSVTETGFTVQRKNLGDTTWQSIFSPGVNTVNYNDSEGTASDKYRVCAKNEFGISAYSNEVLPIIININENNENISQSHLLFGNYPNPFNPTTTIKFIVNKNVTGVYFVKIYNQIGQLVDIIQFNINGKGTYEARWNAIKFSSGVYYYRVEFGDEALIGKMVLMK